MGHNIPEKQAVERHIVDGILQTETTARGIIHKAEAQREEILKKAGEDARALLSESGQRLNELHRSRIEKKQKEMKRKTAALLKKADKEADRVEGLASSRRGSATKLVLRKLDKLVEDGN